MGSHLFDALVRKHNVLGIDNYSLGTYYHPKIHKIDLVDQKRTDQFISEFKPDIVYAAAAWAHEGLSQFIPRKISENNFQAFVNTITPAIRNGVKRFIVFSSMAVYGHQKTPFHEDDKRMPIDIYGVNKTAMEQTTEILSKVHGFEYVILRPHNCYGPRQNMADPYRNVIAIWMNRLLQDKRYFIYGDGTQKRAFSHIDDMIPPLVRALDSPEAKNEIINIGSTVEVTLNDLSNLLLEITNKKNLAPQYVPDRPQEVHHAWSTNDKAETLLDYEDKTPLKQGLTKMWQYALEQGYQEPKYLDELEIVSANTPEIWTKRLL